jgi:hypothetical protein
MPDPKELSNVQPQVRILPNYIWSGIYSITFAFFYFLKAIGQMNMGGNKNALNREIGEDGKRAWSYGLFDCFNHNARGSCTY